MMRPTALRRISTILAVHAKRMLMRRSAFWADGIEQEMHHIPEDWNALQWALGCVFASYAEAARAQPNFLTHVIRVFLAALTFYFSGENLLGPLQTLLCEMQMPHSASRLLAFFPIERAMCISWPMVPLSVQLISLTAGGLYLISALALIRTGPASLRWFIPAVVAGSLAFVTEQGFSAVNLFRHAQLLDPAQMYIIVGRTLSPALVAIALCLSAGKDGKPHLP